MSEDRPYWVERHGRVIAGPYSSRQKAKEMANALDGEFKEGAE
jgi:hypothetical protein